MSGAHPFLGGPAGFPAAAGPGSAVPPAYAHLFNQQQGAFPFGPPGMDTCLSLLHGTIASLRTSI